MKVHRGQDGCPHKYCTFVAASPDIQICSHHTAFIHSIQLAAHASVPEQGKRCSNL